MVRTPLRQSDDGDPSPPPCQRRASCPQLYPRTHLANAPAWAKRRTLPQTVPAVQVLHRNKPGLSLALVRCVKVIAPRLDRSPRHPRSQHCSTEIVRLQGHAEPVGALGQRLKRAGGGMYPGLELVPPKTSPRKSSDLVTVNGCDKHGELLAHACVEAIDDEDALGLSAVETAAKLIMVSSFFSLSCLVPSSHVSSCACKNTRAFPSRECFGHALVVKHKLFYLVIVVLASTCGEHTSFLSKEFQPCA